MGRDAALDRRAQVSAGQRVGVRAEDLRPREIERVRGGVYWVGFDRGGHVEAGLLEPESEAARPGEQVDGHGSVRGHIFDTLPGLARRSHIAIMRRRQDGVRPSRIVAAVADTRTPEQRSRIMAAVRGKNTSPEVALRRALWAAGARGWRCHYRRASGTPDLAWPGRRVAVFVDGAFWHGHPSRHKPGRSGDYWDRKIQTNVERDRRVDRELREAGWTVLRLWDFEVRRDLSGVVERVLEASTRPDLLAARGECYAWGRCLRLAGGGRPFQDIDLREIGGQRGARNGHQAVRAQAHRVAFVGQS